MKSNTLTVSLTALLLAGCVLDEAESLEYSEEESEILGSNKLSANKLSANKLSANKLSANKLSANSLDTQNLLSTADGREFMSYVVSCALPSGQTLTAQDSSGTSYTFAGAHNLAPAWATRAPTISERRWVTACLLARTNVFGVAVNISMRHDTNLALLSTTTERNTYSKPEGAFYGDIFATTPQLFACGNRTWTTYQPSTFRACALSSNGIESDCSFTYTGACTASTTCTDRTAPFGACKGNGVSYSEVITIFLTSTQQQGATQ